MLKEFSTNVDLDATATRTVPLFQVPARGERMTLEDANYTQELDADGTKTVKIRNRTKSRDLTAELDVDALAAQASGAFVLTAGVNKDVDPGDQLELVYTVTVAGTVAPGETAIYMRFRSGRPGFIGG
jgi:hypothetical protein